MNFDTKELKNVYEAVKYKRSILSVDFAINTCFTRVRDYENFSNKLASETNNVNDLKQYKKITYNLVDELLKKSVDHKPIFQNKQDVFINIDWDSERTLKPKNDSAKSFYKKACVFDRRDKQGKTLMSYDTIVATIYKGRGYISDLYSNTTSRHISEFFLQNDLLIFDPKHMYKNYGVDENVAFFWGEHDFV